MTISSVLLLGFTITVAAYLPTLVVPIGALIIAGIAVGSLNVGQINMLQTSTTDDERGQSLRCLLQRHPRRPHCWDTLWPAPLVAQLGIQPLFVVFGVIVLGVGLFLIRVPEIRDHV